MWFWAQNPQLERAKYECRIQIRQPSAPHSTAHYLLHLFVEVAKCHFWFQAMYRCKHVKKTSVFAKRVWEGPPSCSQVQFDCRNRLSVQICTRKHVDLCNLTYASLLKVHLDFSQKSHLYRKYVGQICSKEVVTKKLQKKCHFQIVPSPSQLDSLVGTQYYAHAYKLCALLCAV